MLDIYLISKKENILIRNKDMVYEISILVSGNLDVPFRCVFKILIISS